MPNEVRISLADYDKMRAELQRYREAVSLKVWGDSVEVRVDIRPFIPIIEDLLDEEYPLATPNDYWKDYDFTAYVASMPQLPSLDEE